MAWKAKICPVCKAEFIPTSTNQKYCCNNCTKIARKEWKRYYYKSNPLKKNKG